MTLSEWESQLITHIDELKGELVELCQELIRIPSWDRETRGEAEVAHRVGKTLMKHGIEVEYFPSHPNIENLVATWTRKKSKRRLLFNGHSDVVPPGEDWTVDPFGAEVRDGLIYGRGAMDMKGGVATMAMAICALRDLDTPLQGAVILNVVGDEERQGVLGTTWCIENIWEKIRADACIVAEPTGFAQLGQAVCIGEKGPVWVKITTKGEKAHGSIPSAGKNAIMLMLQLLKALQEQGPPTVPPPISRENLIHQFASILGVEPKQLEPLISGGEGSSPLAAGLEALTETTANVGTISGGVAPNVVPDRCEAQVDFRILPGQKPQEMVDAINTIVTQLGISEAIQIEIIESFEGTSIPNYENDELVKTLFDVSKTVHGPTLYSMVPYATDGRLLRAKGLTSTVVYGPGNTTLAHTADENVAIEDLIKVTKVLALTTIRYLGI